MIKNNHFFLKKKSLCNAVAAVVLAGSVSGVQAQESEESVRAIEEVIVTARRKEESAQETPIAVTALGTEDLYRQNIADLDDLNAVVPGVNFTKSGAFNNTVFSIRGRSRGVAGNALPAVDTYINEIPLTAEAANIPTFDMSSLQVLKGPQGTLFGRNSTSGAVLATTQAPEHEFGGYVTAKIGEYNSRVIEGAVNIPLVEDKVALRIAGQLDDRDGYTDDVLFPKLDKFGNHDRENFRVSLLVEPTENFSNLTVYEEVDVNERPEAIVPIAYRPGEGALPFVPYYSGGDFRFPDTLFPGDPGAGYIIDPTSTLPTSPLVPCNGSPTCDIGVIMERQEAAGPRKVWHNVPSFVKVDTKTLSNTTTWDFGSFTLKNILGYRELATHTFTSIDGTQLPMIGAENIITRKQFSEELQISGEALDGALEYIAGLFYLKVEPDGPNRLALQLFSQSGTPFTNPVFADPQLAAFNGAAGPGDFYTDTSKAVYGQVTYDLSALTDNLEGWSVDFGLRHTKDKSENCPVAGTPAAIPAPTVSDCTESLSEEFSKTTYNLSFNFQVTDDVLLYAVSRTGYRAGGVNSPKFGGQLEAFQFYDPEEVTDFELGMKSDWSLGDVFGRLNVALYHSEYDGVHYAIPTSGLTSLLPNGVDNDGDPSNEPSGGLFTGNAGDATVRGVEIDLVAQLTDNLEVSFGGAKMLRELDVDLMLPATLQPFAASGGLGTQDDIEAVVFLSAPDWSYNLGGTYTLPLDSEIGEVALTARHFRMSGVQHGDGFVKEDPYGITDLRADWYGVMGTSLDAALYVTNVTDEEAIIAPAMSGSNIGLNSGIYNEPRMWGASLRYSF